MTSQDGCDLSARMSALMHEYAEDFVPTATFTPVCPLPDLVEVVTGEEDEDVLFCEPAKLFLFDRELHKFKERGIGDLKILKHKTNGKIRILMRREPIHKLCANHYVLPPMELKPMPKNDNAWTWFAMDFADGEVSADTFAVRFETSSVAAEFKSLFDKAVEKKKKTVDVTAEVKTVLDKSALKENSSSDISTDGAKGKENKTSDITADVNSISDKTVEKEKNRSEITMKVNCVSDKIVSDVPENQRYCLRRRKNNATKP